MLQDSPVLLSWGTLAIIKAQSWAALPSERPSLAVLVTWLRSFLSFLPAPLPVSLDVLYRSTNVYTSPCNLGKGYDKIHLFSPRFVPVTSFLASEVTIWLQSDKCGRLSSIWSFPIIFFSLLAQIHMSSLWEQTNKRKWMTEVVGGVKPFLSQGAATIHLQEVYFSFFFWQGLPSASLPWSYYVDQTGHNHRNLLAFASHWLGLKTLTIMPGGLFYFIFNVMAPDF